MITSLATCNRNKNRLSTAFDNDFTNSSISQATAATRIVAVGVVTSSLSPSVGDVMKTQQVSTMKTMLNPTTKTMPTTIGRITKLSPLTKTLELRKPTHQDETSNARSNDPSTVAENNASPAVISAASCINRCPTKSTRKARIRFPISPSLATEAEIPATTPTTPTGVVRSSIRVPNAMTNTTATTTPKGISDSNNNSAPRTVKRRFQLRYPLSLYENMVQFSQMNSPGGSLVEEKNKCKHHNQQQPYNKHNKIHDNENKDEATMLPTLPLFNDNNDLNSRDNRSPIKSHNISRKCSNSTCEGNIASETRSRSSNRSVTTSSCLDACNNDDKENQEDNGEVHDHDNEQVDCDDDCNKIGHSDVVKKNQSPTVGVMKQTHNESALQELLGSLVTNHKNSNENKDPIITKVVRRKKKDRMVVLNNGLEGNDTGTIDCVRGALSTLNHGGERLAQQPQPHQQLTSFVLRHRPRHSLRNGNDRNVSCVTECDNDYASQFYDSEEERQHRRRSSFGIRANPPSIQHTRSQYPTQQMQEPNRDLPPSHTLSESSQSRRPSFSSCSGSARKMKLSTRNRRTSFSSSSSAKSNHKAGIFSLDSDTSYGGRLRVSSNVRLINSYESQLLREIYEANCSDSESD